MKILKIGIFDGSDLIYIRSIEDVRRFVEEFTPGFTRINGITDLSYMSREAQSVLLKFIEEKVSDIVCFASRDNVNPVLMSRFDKIERNENINIGTGSFSAYCDFIMEKEQKDSVSEREFVSRCSDRLDCFSIFNRLTLGEKIRIGKYL